MIKFIEDRFPEILITLLIVAALAIVIGITWYDHTAPCSAFIDRQIGKVPMRCLSELMNR